MNRRQIRLLSSKSTDLDWNCSRPYQKLKFFIRDLLFMPFMKLKKNSSAMEIFYVEGSNIKLQV